MPVDSSIYFQQQSPDIFGSIQKGMSLREMMDDGRERRRLRAEDEAMRTAATKNTVTDANGVTSLNQAGYLSDLAKVNPMKAIETQRQFTAQKRQDEMAEIDGHIKKADALGRILGSATDQPSYDAARGTAFKMGLIGQDTMPNAYDPKFVQNMQAKTLTIKDQFERQFKERTAGQKDRELDIREKELGVKRTEAGVKRGERQTATNDRVLQNTTQLLESARGNPAVAQAEKDLYSSEKANSLATLYGDPNKLTKSQVNLLVSEIGKIASGGVPSMHELEGITPNTLTGSLSKSWERLSNDPTPANAGQFVKQYQDYAKSLARDAKKVIQDKYGRVIESRKRELAPDDYNTLKTHYVDRFNETEAAAAAPKVFKTNEIEWAD